MNRTLLSSFWFDGQEDQEDVIDPHEEAPEMGTDDDDLSLICSGCGDTMPCRCMFVNNRS